jgi:hypothetical protein
MEQILAAPLCHHNHTCDKSRRGVDPWRAGAFALAEAARALATGGRRAGPETRALKT